MRRQGYTGRESSKTKLKRGDEQTGRREWGKGEGWNKDEKMFENKRSKQMFGKKQKQEKKKQKQKQRQKQQPKTHKTYTILHKARQQNKNERNLKKKKKRQEEEMGEFFKAGKTGKQRMS